MTNFFQLKALEASRAVDAAKDELYRAAKTAYPVGCYLAVTLGRSRVVGEVTAHGPYGDRDDVFVRNEKTGKIRHFPAGSQYGSYDPVILTDHREYRRLQKEQLKRDKKEARRK